MKYYSYTDPFSALIAASSRAESDALYKKEVLYADDADSEGDNDFEPARELTEHEAAARCGKVGVDVRTVSAPGILLIDAELV